MQHQAQAFDLLRKLGVNDADIPKMVKVYEGTRHQQAFKFLEENQNPQMLEHFVDTLSRPGVSSARAAEFLKRIGPPAESAVWQALEHPNVATRIAGVDVLREIGTEASLKYIEPFVDDRFLGPRAQAAIAEIKAKRRRPVREQ